MSSFYVTTPIYYVNDMPHLGHIYTTVVADVLARYRRGCGQEVRFLTGTDEHGQKIERAARKAGVMPIELADRVVERYRELWKRLDISHDDFLRTTEARHEAAVPVLIERMRAAGDVYTARHEGWYCTGCETFYTEKELVEPGHRCRDHDTPTEWRSEENLFFRLSRYQDALLEWYDRHPESVRPATRRNEVRSFVAQGLRDLSISRFGLDWGVPFPEAPGHSVWVWLDALTNYISALGFAEAGGEGTLFQQFWREGDERLHVVGKDIVRFHAVYWPAFLMSAGLPLPTTVWAHGWWLRDERKMSKSVGNVVRPDHLVERFGPDVLRYYLMREMVFGQDASFSDEAFIDRFNSDLANDLGNTVSRLVTLSRQAFAGQTPPTPCDSNPLIAAAARAVTDYEDAMKELAFHRALEALWRLLAEANQYIVAREPWKVLKQEGASEGLSRVLWNGLEAVRIVVSGLSPFTPHLAERVAVAIGASGTASGAPSSFAWGGLPTSVALPEPQPLFPRVDKAEFLASLAPEPVPAATSEVPAAVASKNPLGEATMIGIDEFSRVELRVARVLLAERVPKSNKLLRLELDLGEEAPRQVVAGIGKKYAPEELVGRQVVVVANLAPAQLMGVESRGMVLAASPDGDPVLLDVAGPVPAGTRVK